MADRLEITGWDVQRWGGGSDRRANDLPTGWTVVLGQNEEGKSSVAAALAWLLAGFPTSYLTLPGLTCHR